MIEEKDLSFIEVTPDNVSEYGVCCVVNRKSPGFKAKLNWFSDILNSGVRIIIAFDKLNNKQLGFIEFTDSELAWRPIKAENLLFIHCISVFSISTRNNSIGSRLIQYCSKIAESRGKDGICTMSSKGTWMANKTLFEKNGFTVIEKADRFELMFKKLGENAVNPRFNDWKAELAKLKGWHLIYSDQCPWHEKSVNDLVEHAKEVGVNISLTKLASPLEAQKAPSGYGGFSLVRDGRLLSDHYISKTRFQNILKKELP